MIDHAHQYALPVMPVILGVFIGAAMNSASCTSCFVTSWYAMSSSLGSKSKRGSSAGWGLGRNSVVLSRLHLSVCITTGSPPSPFDSTGDVYVHLSLVLLWKFLLVHVAASSVSFK